MLDQGKEDSVLNVEELKQSLIVGNNFLVKIVDTIPAKMYFENEIQDKISTEKHSSMNKAAEAIKRKSNNHIELSAKGKHKWARLNPLLQKSVSQIHNELDRKKRRNKKNNRGVDNPSASLTRAANVEELQKRLQERIDLLQASRNATRNDPKAKKKLDRKLKKLKIKQKGNLLKPPEPPTDILKIPKEKKEINKEKPTFNKEGNLIYSKFDFSENGLENSKKGEYANKKTKVLLKKAEKKKEKIEKLKEEDPEKAKTVLEKEKWKKAILKTEGVKIKDDPKLLKRSLKREEKKKKKSAKAWNERTQETEKKKQARQERRNRNIKQRKDEKREHKLKLAKKKGRIIRNV